MQIPLWLVGLDLLIASVVFMTLWFGLSLYAKRLDVVGAAWGLNLIYMAAIVLVLDGRFEAFHWAVFGFVVVWGVRLFFHNAARLQGSQEDSRYQVYRKKWGKNVGVQAFLRIFLLRAVAAVLVVAPAVAAISSSRDPIWWLSALGFAVWGFGIVFETIADQQLTRFTAQKAGRAPGEVLQKGLWRLSRHPNYFGEIVAWTGAALVALSVGQWWGLIGPVAALLLIWKIFGIPQIERQFAGNEKYQAYQQKTTILVPMRQKHVQ